MTQANNVAIESSQINSSGVLQPAGGGTGVTTSTGSGNNVLSASPTLSGTAVIPTINAGAATALTLQSAGTTAFTIDTSQNVGIGTTSPSSKLTVGGNPPTAGAIAGVGSSGGVALALSDNINSSLYVRTASGGAIIGTDGGGLLRFATNGNTATEERMRIDSSGNVFVGGTTQNTANSPVYSSTTAKAWVSCNANTSPTINASFNVSSVVYNSTGNYTVNFTNAFADTNYCETMGTWEYQRGWTGTYTKTTSSFRFEMHNTANGSTINMSYINMAFFR
jgi:hypothetical protein